MNIEYLYKEKLDKYIYLVKVEDKVGVYYLFDTKENIDNECALYFKDINKVLKYLKNEISNLEIIIKQIESLNDKYYIFLEKRYTYTDEYFSNMVKKDLKEIENYKNELRIYNNVYNFCLEYSKQT